MSPRDAYDSVRIIGLAVMVAAIVLVLVGIATIAFGAQSDDYVTMSKATFELMLRAMNACVQGARI